MQKIIAIGHKYKARKYIIGLVEDNIRLRELLTLRIEQAGFTVLNYPGFGWVPDWDACDYWILDNYTGERVQGKHIVLMNDNSLLLTSAEFDEEMEALAKKGRAYNKLELDEAIAYIKNQLELNSRNSGIF